LKKTLAFLAAVSLASAAQAARPRSGVLSSDFDGKPSGARYIGMGETGASASGEPESPLWNPAALNDLAGPLFSMDFDVAKASRLDDDVLTQSSSLRGRKLTYIGFGAPDAAFFYRPLANFNRQVVTVSTDPANNFMEEDLKIDQFGITVSQEMEKGKGASVGLNISYLMARRGTAVAAAGQAPQINLADGNGFTVDLGFRSKRDTLMYGFTLYNVAGLMYWNDFRTDQLPFMFRGGITFQPAPLFSFSSDYEKRWYRGGLPQPDLIHLGMEMGLAPWLAVRGGTYGEDLNDVDKVNYTGGFSVISPKQHRLDFALRTYRLLEERVYNYFLSLILPLPGKVKD